MALWHVTEKLILLVRLFLKGIILGGGGHKVRGWVKLMLPVGSYLAWERVLAWGLARGDRRDWHWRVGEETRLLVYAHRIG